MKNRTFYSILTFLAIYPAAVLIGSVAMVYGCQNYFELGCPPGLGREFGFVSFVLVLLSVFALPLGGLGLLYETSRIKKIVGDDERQKAKKQLSILWIVAALAFSLALLFS